MAFAARPRARAMIGMGLPRALVLLLFLLSYMNNIASRQKTCVMILIVQEPVVGDIDSAEIYCGQGALTMALKETCI